MSVASTFAQGTGIVPGPIYYSLFFELNFSGIPSLGTMDAYLIVRAQRGTYHGVSRLVVSPRLPILDLL